MTPLLALLASAAVALADPSAARFLVEGRVLDPTGAPLVGAQVTALSSDQRTPPTTWTDANGAFRIALVPGRYTVKAAASGFLEGSKDVVALDSGSETQEFVLKVAPFGETVTVRAPGGYRVGVIGSATKTLTPLLDVPQ